MDQFEPRRTSPSLVSIIVPALNEEQNISRCVNELSKAMGSAGYNPEIIVVNDGSTYGTLSVARSMQIRYGLLRVLDLKPHYRKATALKEGVRAARQMLSLSLMQTCSMMQHVLREWLVSGIMEPTW